MLLSALSFLSDPNAETRDTNKSKSVCLLPENSEAESEEGWRAGWSGSKVSLAGGSSHKGRGKMQSMR